MPAGSGAAPLARRGGAQCAVEQLLVAEPVPLKYLNQPNEDKRDEVRGRQVLDKFNCSGCHQIRPGPGW